MTTPVQMFDNMLDALKGWPSPYALDKSVDLAAGEPTVVAGRVLSLNASGKFQLGLACNAMPIFAWQKSTDFDVVGDDGNLVGSGGGDPTGGSPVPKLSGLVATGAYELQSTEFDATQAYAPNAPLTAGAPGAADAGVIKPAAGGNFYGETVCGVVSDGVGASENHGIDLLTFWSVFIPALECPGSSEG